MSLPALSLQKRFEARPDRKTHFLPVATPDNNHRAAWIGGGGVGKTHTHTDQSCGATRYYILRPEWLCGGRASQSRSTESWSTRPNSSLSKWFAHDRFPPDSSPTTQSSNAKKMDRTAGETGIDVIDELGCVSGTLLHADALRKTYGRSLRYNL